MWNNASVEYAPDRIVDASLRILAASPNPLRLPRVLEARLSGCSEPDRGQGRAHLHSTRRPSPLPRNRISNRFQGSLVPQRIYIGPRYGASRGSVQQESETLGGDEAIQRGASRIQVVAG